MHHDSTPRRHLISKTCLTCGVDFEVVPARESTAKFCSPACYHESLKRELSEVERADRFWTHVLIGADDECWEWQGATVPKGYGKVRFQNRTQTAHRVAFYLHHERWPQGLACHHCDNPRCVNPHHLFEGTPKDNTLDMLSKEREARGERKASAKITQNQVLEIRLRYARRQQPFDHLNGPAALASEFGVGPSTIIKIAKGKRWKHVNP